MPRWYAIHTKPRLESQAEEHLQRQGFETYLPRCRRGRRRNGRCVESIEPLFPRYLFIHLSFGLDNISTIKSTRGVSRIVQFGHKPEHVPNDLIDALKAMEIESETNLVDTMFQKGDDIQMLKGPFAGLEGIFMSDKGEDRAMIMLSMLGRDNIVTVARDQIAAAI